MACVRASRWCLGQIVHGWHRYPALSVAFGTLPEKEDVFDRELKAAHRSRAVHAAGPGPPDDSFQRECAERLLDKLRDVTKHFTRVLVLGGAGHMFTQLFLEDEKSMKIRQISYIDQSWEMANKFRELQQRATDSNITFNVQLADEEFIPFPDKSFDCALLPCAPHLQEVVRSHRWAIVPQYREHIRTATSIFKRAFAECRRVLQPDGMFLASMLGGDTLFELRNACHLAEEEREGGFSLRTSPLVHVRDAGILLSGAKFTLQTVDIDDIVVQYEDVADAITHLRVNSEQNAALHRRRELPRDTALAAAALFAHGADATEAGVVTSTFQLICCSGWAPDISQQRPSKRGSAAVSMKDIPGATAG